MCYMDKNFYYSKDANFCPFSPLRFWHSSLHSDTVETSRLQLNDGVNEKCLMCLCEENREKGRGKNEQKLASME